MAALFDFTAPSPAANGASYSKGMKTEQEKKSTDLVPTDFHTPREDFQIPVPGQDGAEHGSLKGKTVVLTGSLTQMVI